MVSRTGLHVTARQMLVKVFVVLAANFLGPGRLRLEMVKLAHELGDSEKSSETLYGRRRAGP